MKDLITEARELCERATDGPWEWTVSNDFGSELEAENLKGVIGLEDDYPGYPECGEHLIMNLSKADAAFIARSRTLIPELCDALEKAKEQNKQLLREVSNLAAESVKRDVTLARLEAEVEHAITATRWIPVAERLPERNDKILAYTPPKPGYAELCEVTRGFMAQLGKRSGITHWMPLPEPPEEGE